MPLLIAVEAEGLKSRHRPRRNKGRREATQAMAAMAAAVPHQHLASVVALRGGEQRVSGVDNAAATTFKPTRTTRTFPLIECAKHAQEKATKHHLKTRPKKKGYDRNRKGPTNYPPVTNPPPPIWGFDEGEALTSDNIDANTVVKI